MLPPPFSLGCCRLPAEMLDLANRPVSWYATRRIITTNQNRHARRKVVIRLCGDKDFDTMYAIINKAAEKYEGVIPPDRWETPYMPKDELKQEIKSGIVFWGCERNGKLVGVMGLQHVKDVTLIRHAYVLPAEQGQGIGSELLSFLAGQTSRPILIGTWAAADWAVRFYETRGFRLVPAEEKDRLLEKYWSIPRRQVETSVVLADQTWFQLRDQARDSYS
jgi:N-acetylglutamate synthase-like GNAT family acetyltransferase